MSCMENLLVTIEIKYWLSYLLIRLTFLEMLNHSVSNISLSCSLGLSCDGINPLPPLITTILGQKRKLNEKCSPPSSTSTPYS